MYFFSKPNKYYFVRYLIVLFLFSLSFSLFAQKIVTGKVLDVEGLAPLIGASVCVYTADSIYRTFADISGNYFLELPDSVDMVEFQYEGWYNAHLEIPQNNRLDAYLVAGGLPIYNPRSIVKREKPISGTVLDLKGNSLPNVSMIFEATLFTASSEKDGSFSAMINRKSNKLFFFYNNVWTCRRLPKKGWDKLTFRLDGKGILFFDHNGYPTKKKLRCSRK